MRSRTERTSEEKRRIERTERTERDRKNETWTPKRRERTELGLHPLEGQKGPMKGQKGQNIKDRKKETWTSSFGK